MKCSAGLKFPLPKSFLSATFWQDLVFYLTNEVEFDFVQSVVAEINTGEMPAALLE